jgi:hypothetical protein
MRSDDEQAEDGSGVREPEQVKLYQGDTGAIPEDARRVLVQLLAGPSIDSRRHSKLWPALLRYRDVIHSRLSELFLELIVDEDLQVAFTRQADTSELDAPKLLRRSPLTFLDSALMLYLRQLLTDADIQGQRAVVSSEEIVEQLRLYEKSQSTDQAGFEKRITSAIEKAKKNSILSAIPGGENRYEISPTLKLLFNAEEISALIKIYQTYQDNTTVETSDGTSESPDS